MDGQKISITFTKSESEWMILLASLKEAEIVLENSMNLARKDLGTASELRISKLDDAKLNEYLKLYNELKMPLISLGADITIELLKDGNEGNSFNKKED